jgi:hypothetical protein
MRYLNLAVCVAAVSACSSNAPSAPTVQAVDGHYTAATSFYRAVDIDIVERADDGQLSGRWVGIRADGARPDSGIVYYGQRLGADVTFGVTAINGLRSLAVSATETTSGLVGSATMTDNGAHFPAERVTFRRQ